MVNSTQGTLALIGVGDHSSGNLSASVQQAHEPCAHEPRTSSLHETPRTLQPVHPAAFDFIYRLHLRRVYALCLRMVKDPAEAEDLTQETFIQVFRKIHTFRGEAAFASWLYRLTTNLVLMSFRQKSPVSMSLDHLTSDPGKAEFPQLGAPDADLSGLLDRLNLQAAVPMLSRCCKALLCFMTFKVTRIGRSPRFSAALLSLPRATYSGLTKGCVNCFARPLTSG